MQFEFDNRDCRFRVKHFTRSLHFIGPSENQTSTSQTSENLQTTVGNAADGSTQLAVGTQSTLGFVGSGSVSSSGGGNVSVTTLDAQVAHDALLSATGVAENAIANNTTATANALGFGAEALTIAGQGQANALTFAQNAATTSTQNALGFGAEALNSVVNLSVQQASVNSNALASYETTANALASELAQITANAAPQSSAAQSEIMAGTSPAGNTATGVDKWASIAVIGGFIVAAVALLKGKNS